MKRLASFILVLFVTIFFAKAQNKVQLLKINQLEKILTQNSDSKYIINLWATWCGPCVAEIPHFESFYAKNKIPNLKLILLSLDAPKDLEKVQKFINQKGLKAPVLLLNESNPDNYIPKIAENWEGNLPTTIFVDNKNNKKILVDKPLTYKEITKFIAELNN